MKFSEMTAYKNIKSHISVMFMIDHLIFSEIILYAYISQNI